MYVSVLACAVSVVARSFIRPCALGCKPKHYGSALACAVCGVIADDLLSTIGSKNTAVRKNINIQGPPDPKQLLNDASALIACISPDIAPPSEKTPKLDTAQQQHGNR